MISEIRDWASSLIACTLLISVIQAMLPDGTVRRISSFVGSLLLLFCALSPILNLDLSELELDRASISDRMEDQQFQFTEDTSEKLAKCIAESTASYISGKASQSGVRIDAFVETSRQADGLVIPCAVRLSGPYSAELAACIENDLGIPPERQVWIQ